MKNTLYITPELAEDLTKLDTAYLNPDGSEVNNPKPIVLHTFLDRPLSLQEQIERVMAGNLSRQAMEQGFETLDESQDFDVDDEFNSGNDESMYQIVDEEVPLMQQEPDGTADPSGPTFAPGEEQSPQNPVPGDSSSPQGDNQEPNNNPGDGEAIMQS